MKVLSKNTKAVVAMHEGIVCCFKLDAIRNKKQICGTGVVLDENEDHPYLYRTFGITYLSDLAQTFLNMYEV